MAIVLAFTVENLDTPSKNAAIKRETESRAKGI
jgi:hypothetical protein